MTEILPPLQLRAEHMRDARLFADRRDMIRSIAGPTSRIGEIGVALGDFSEFLIDTLRPSEFIAIDTFKIHEMDMLWGRPTSEIFNGKTHEEFFRERMSKFRDCTVVIDAGLSHERIALQQDASFDLLYIDADHRYEAVYQDAMVSCLKIKPSGTIIFNDYILYDHVEKHPYGVVQVVNNLVVEHGFKIVAFALQRYMFCDIAISR